MSATSASDNAERGYTITRVFDAPRALVWSAITEPEQFAQWFGPVGSTLDIHEMDVRPGGAWRATLHFAGMEMPWAGRWEEVDAPSRVVLAFVDQPTLGDEFDLMTFTLTEADDRTELVLRQSGGHLTDEQYGQAKEGTAAFLDRMAELVART
jgi:uncharacterized protein YndB with AHSA1/START domain